MSSDKVDKKKYEKKIIKHINKKYSDKSYSLKEFDDIVIKINEDDKIDDYKRVRKVMSKFSKIKKDKISFDTETENDLSYKEIKNEIKKNLPDKKIEIQKPKSSGFFNFTKKAMDITEVNTKPTIIKEKSSEVLYKYPSFNTYNATKKEGLLYEPYGTQWIHDKQNDDEIDKYAKSATKIVDELMSIEYPEQKSEEWHNLRDKRATASDGGCILNENHYEPQYKFLIKKVMRPPFTGAKNCYHGCKYEQTATLLYEYRMNVKVEEFGLVAHPKYYFLAASPDGIISKYKLDGKSLTKHVGRMLEIKCTTTREIIMDGEIKDNICPIYYWIQVQLQLECCNLEECDFWQCKIIEYEDRDEFIEDTDLSEPFRSKSLGQEKGCVIQVLPKNKYEDIKAGKYWDVVYDSAKYLYPPKIEMSPIECDIWIAETMGNFNKIMMENKLDPNDYFFDCVKYWKLIKSKCVLIKRERDWFAEHLPHIQKMWNLVEYFRENKDKSDLFFSWIEALPLKNNKKIIEVAEFMKNEPNENDSAGTKSYTKRIVEIKEELEKNKNRKPIKKFYK